MNSTVRLMMRLLSYESPSVAITSSAWSNIRIWRGVFCVSASPDSRIARMTPCIRL